MKISEARAMIPYLFNARITPLIVGHKGIGKTEMVEQLGKELNFDRVLNFKLGNLQDQADLLGLMQFFKDTNGDERTTYARPTFWPNPGEKVLIFFDELNRTNRQLIQPVMELALEFRHHDYILPEGCRIIAAMNPATDEYDVQDLSDAALLDRFCHIKLTPSASEWSKFMKKKGADTLMVQFFAENPSYLDGAGSSFDTKCTPSRRKVDAILTRIMPQNPEKKVLALVTQGLLGTEASAAFLSFIENQTKPISGEALINSFPENRERFEALCKIENGQGRADILASSVDNACDFLNTLEKDMLSDAQVAAVKEIITLAPLEYAKALAKKTLKHVKMWAHTIGEDQQLYKILSEKAAKSEEAANG